MATESTQTNEPSKQETHVKVETEVVESHTVTSPQARTARAEAIIRRNVLWALGVGIVPIPLVDLIGATAIQVKMLKQLSDVYGVSYREDAAKKVITTLVSAIGSVGVGTALAASFSKIVPVIGPALGVLTLPVTMAAFTLATGRVFLMHFESGGTLLDFDPAAMRAYFRDEFERAKETVVQIQKEEQIKTKTVKTS